MEWVDGDSLIKLLKPGTEVTPFDGRLAARIAAETCAGLHAAHTQHDSNGQPLSIVHRDVSPHNILLSADGVVKVTDFGVAKAAGQTHDQTVAGQLKGKLEYMSPEQITGGRVDGRTDVFGMGGVIYEATTGRQPFASSGDLEAMTKIVEGRLAPPSTHVRNYPRELEAIVLCAMATDPANRFASADDMRAALEAFIARSGPPVGHAEVAQLLRSRVGAKMDERLERIQAAMSERPDRHNSHTPSGAGISTSGVIPTNRPPRVAPAPPGVPKLALPAAGARPAPRGGAPAPLPAVFDDDDGPDSSGFNMDTVADFQLPAYLDPGSRTPGPGQAAPGPQGHDGAHDGLFRGGAAPPARDQSAPDQEPPLDMRQYILAAVAGVAVAVVLGGAAYAAWRFLGPTSPSPPAQHVQHVQPQQTQPWHARLG